MNIDELLATLQKLNINITNKEIADAWGMEASSFSRKKRNKSQISYENIKKIEDKLNIKLTFAEVLNKEKLAPALEWLNNDGQNSIMQIDTIAVDYYPDVFGSCGSGSFVFSEQKEILQVPRRCFQTFSDFRKYSIINATGDSMTPYICDRDRLIVEHWQGEQIRDNRIYIFRFGDNIFIKRLVLNLDQIIVKSDNKEYGVRYIEKKDADDFQIIGRIVGIWREEL